MTNQNNATLILERSWELFQRKGFRGVSVDEICNQCGLTKPTLYYYFKNKENLFIKVLEYKMQGINKSITQPGTLDEKLTRFALTILQSFGSGYSLLLREHEHFKNLENSHKIREAFQENLYLPLQELIKTGIEEKELRGKEPYFLALAFLGIVNNLIGKDSEFGLDTQTLAEEIVKFFLEGAQNE